ncbi:MAG TPA: VanW family protein [bacterium]|nr:VanW family protein [bacterium]HQB76404.1 VanW family protein [bacterium]
MSKKHLPIIAIIAVLVVFLFLIVLTANLGKSDSTLSDNLYFGGLDISGLDKAQAETMIKKEYQTMVEKGLTLKYGDSFLSLPATSASFDADLSYPHFHYTDDNIKASLEAHTKPGLLARWWRQLFGPKNIYITPTFKLDEEKIKKTVQTSLTDAFYPAVDAAFIFTKNNIEITPERPGKTIDWEALFKDIKNRLELFTTDPIVVKTKTEYPEIYARDLIGLENEADNLSRNPLTLVFNDKSWPVTREEIASWLYVRKQDGKLNLAFSPERIAKYLNDNIADKINVSPQDPRFEIKDNKVSSWQLGKDGYELDSIASASEIINQYFASSEKNEKNISLIVKTLPPAIAEDFDIKEIIGTGHSNFAGSSANRRHNIEVGAAAVNGILIKPGEEFSLVKTLGAINASTGYLPELVIKNNKTIPEYGGGLCQIGTTIFRSALASGLPITARQNHSYRVSYYEPAGTDAAVYDPWPDVRFINDTPKAILIQSRIEGNDIYFDFWGTKDGRSVTTTTPVIYNIVKPPATKIVESDELSPGEKKCTEQAHNGADTYFDYTVTYPEGATSTPLEKTRRFSSHYVPWQEVCLVGKIATSTPDTETASSSPTVETGSIEINN